MADRTIRIGTRPREGLNLLLALVAGALAVLVLLTARDVLTTPRGAATPAPTITPAQTATAAPTTPTPVPTRGEDRHGGRGRG